MTRQSEIQERVVGVVRTPQDHDGSAKGGGQGFPSQPLAGLHETRLRHSGADQRTGHGLQRPVQCPRQGEHRTHRAQHALAQREKGRDDAAWKRNAQHVGSCWA